jgi:hypothetical protein
MVNEVRYLEMKSHVDTFRRHGRKISLPNASTSLGRGKCYSWPVSHGGQLM